MKIVIHFADAPAHGLRYHDSTVTDFFSSGDPRGAQGACETI